METYRIVQGYVGDFWSVMRQQPDGTWAHVASFLTHGGAQRFIELGAA